MGGRTTSDFEVFEAAARSGNSPNKATAISTTDAWALVGPVASNLAERAARTVKNYAERGIFDSEEAVEPRLRAA